MRLMDNEVLINLNVRSRVLSGVLLYFCMMSIIFTVCILGEYSFKGCVEVLSKEQYTFEMPLIGSSNYY